MDEKELKTSPKQRIFIALIAVFMVGSIVASYIAIVLSNNSASDSGSSQIDNAKLAEYQKTYNDKEAEFEATTKEDFDRFSKYRSNVAAYNETTANTAGLQTRDLEEGTGKELTAGDTDYLAYYIGWCADESVFDSSFNNNNNPTALSRALDPSRGLIQGWEDGVIGMKLGGVREITIPGELAYKDTQEICGGTYKPLKFIVMAVPNEDPLKTLAKDLEMSEYIYQIYAAYGISLSKEELQTMLEADQATIDQSSEAVEATETTDTTDTTDSTESE